MNVYRLNHFHNVARAMNHYVAASAYNYYHPNHYHVSRHDRSIYIAAYQRPSLLHSGVSSLLAYGLNAIGMPAGVVKFGYRVGQFFDVHA